MRTLNYIYIYTAATSSIDLTIYYMVHFSGAYIYIYDEKRTDEIKSVAYRRRRFGANKYILSIYHNPVRDGSNPVV